MAGEAFITTKELGAYLRRDVEGEMIAEIACEAACDTLRDMIGMVLDARTGDIATFNVAPGQDSLLLPELPVVGVDSVELISSLTGTPTELALTSYRIDFVNGIIYRVAGVWPAGRQTVRVTYTHGYAAQIESGSGLWSDPPASGSGSGDDGRMFPAWPRTLRMLALQAAARIYDQGLVKQESTGGYQAIYASDETLGFTRRELNLIAKYRRGR